MEQLVRCIGCIFLMEATRRRHAGGGELSRAGLDSRPPPAPPVSLETISPGPSEEFHCCPGVPALGFRACP